MRDSSALHFLKKQGTPSAVSGPFSMLTSSPSRREGIDPSDRSRWSTHTKIQALPCPGSAATIATQLCVRGAACSVYPVAGDGLAPSPVAVPASKESGIQMHGANFAEFTTEFSRNIQTLPKTEQNLVRCSQPNGPGSDQTIIVWHLYVANYFSGLFGSRI